MIQKRESRKAFILPWAALTLAVAGIVLLVVLAFVAAGESLLDSDTPVTPGCDPPPFPVRVLGSLVVDDSATFGVEARAKEVSVESVSIIGARSYNIGAPLRGFTEQNYQWKVTATNPKNGNVISKDDGGNVHPGGGVLQENDFAVSFTVPDNNCDNKLDDFTFEVQGEVVTDDGEKSVTPKKIIQFQGGRIT